MASITPEIALASAVREAKPRTAAAMAVDVRNGATSLCSEANCDSAMKTPIATIVASIRRRRKRRRVSASGVRRPAARRRATCCAWRARARSTSQTTRRVTATVIAAVIHWLLCDHQEATSGVAPWGGMERDRSVALERRAVALPRVPESLRVAWRLTWTTRALVWAAGLAAVGIWGVSAREHDFDPAGLTSAFAPLSAPAARWDSVWYLTIAHDGYGAPQRAAFFPLYPLLVRAGGRGLGSPLIAGVLIAMACFVVGLAVLHELTRLELGGDPARWTVVALALSPMSLFFSAVY